MLHPEPTHPVMQRLFWILRVVTSLFIGAVILGECGQLTWAAACIPSLLSWLPHRGSASGWASRPPCPHASLTLALSPHIYLCPDRCKPPGCISPTFLTFFFRGKQVKMNACGDGVYGGWRERMVEGCLLCFGD